MHMIEALFKRSVKKMGVSFAPTLFCVNRITGWSSFCIAVGPRVKKSRPRNRPIVAPLNPQAQRPFLIPRGLPTGVSQTAAGAAMSRIEPQKDQAVETPPVSLEILVQLTVPVNR